MLRKEATAAAVQSHFVQGYLPVNPLKPGSLFLFIIIITIAISNQLNKSVDPCEDFYSYACGGFFKEHKLSNKVGEITSFSIVRWENLKVLRHALENDARYSQVETQLILSYSSLFSRSGRNQSWSLYTQSLTRRALLALFTWREGQYSVEACVSVHHGNSRRWYDVRLSPKGKHRFPSVHRS